MLRRVGKLYKCLAAIPFSGPADTQLSFHFPWMAVIKGQSNLEQLDRHKVSAKLALQNDYICQLFVF